MQLYSKLNHAIPTSQPLSHNASLKYQFFSVATVLTLKIIILIFLFRVVFST